MRIVRPLNAPDDRQVREDFWNADIAEIADDARNRIQDNGKGSYGIVDPQLPQAIDELNKDR
jgi:hypothetical protein